MCLWYLMFYLWIQGYEFYYSKIQWAIHGICPEYSGILVYHYIQSLLQQPAILTCSLGTDQYERQERRSHIYPEKEDIVLLSHFFPFFKFLFAFWFSISLFKFSKFITFPDGPIYLNSELVMITKEHTLMINPVTQYFQIQIKMEES